MSKPVHRVIRIERFGIESFQCREVTESGPGEFAPCGRPIISSPTLDGLRDLAESLADAVARPVIQRAPLDLAEGPWIVHRGGEFWTVLNTRTGRTRRVGRIGRSATFLRAREMADIRNKEEAAKLGSRQLADQAFEDFDFGDARVVEHSGWETDGGGHWRKSVFVRSPDREDTATRLITFVVRFRRKAAPQCSISDSAN